MTTAKITKLPTELVALKHLYIDAKAAYYEAQPIMSDALFDKMEKQLMLRVPLWVPLHKTGVLPQKKTKCKLDKFMPSLHKRYPTHTDIAKACTVTPKHVVMSKLDGSSLLMKYVNGVPTQLVTRGNGIIGGDISFHIKNLNLPSNKRVKGTHYFRCEAVMPESVFKKKWSKEFDNSRNMVNGLLNRKEPHPAYADIAIVVLGCFDHTIIDGLAIADDLGLEFVSHSTHKLNPDQLQELLEQYRADSPYTIDGLVVAPTKWVMQYADADKPKDIWAYKLNDEGNAAVVEVKRIIWQLSGRGRLIPKIEIEPTQMDGVMVTYCTSHNAQWMMDRNVGPGAKLKVLRSGGVIPKIVGVVKPGKFQPPKELYKVEGVHFVISDKGRRDVDSSVEIHVCNLVKFMTTLGIEFIAEKTLRKFVSAFPLPINYVRAWHTKKLAKVLVAGGLGDKQTEKIVAEFDRVLGGVIPLRKLMVAVQVFPVGIGERKLAMIESFGISMDEVTYMVENEAQDHLTEVPGFGSISAKLVAKKLPVWKEMYLRFSPMLRLNGDLPKAKKAIATGSLSGEKVTFTSYRDKDQEAKVLAAGGEIISFSAKTTLLLYKEGGKFSSKVDTARARGVKVKTFEQLKL